MSNQTVVFDLDGTLIDTAPDLILATNHVLEGAGFDPASAEYLRPYISYGARRMIAEGLKPQSDTVSQTDIDAMFVKFIDFYSANIAVKSAPFPGMIDVLDGLRSQGATIAICTNKQEQMAKLLMRELDLTHHFEVITGRDTFPVCKPDPAHLVETVRLAGGNVAHAVMVGDSTTDYETAKAAKIPIIGVIFGYTDVPLVELDCEAVISHYREFHDALHRITKARQ